MANPQISKPEMLKRVARFKELVPSEYAFVDSKIPGHERLIYNVIGNGVTEDAALRPEHDRVRVIQPRDMGSARVAGLGS